MASPAIHSCKYPKAILKQESFSQTCKLQNQVLSIYLPNPLKKHTYYKNRKYYGQQTNHLRSTRMGTQTL